MPKPFTSQSRTLRTSGPTWLALIALVWWAALLNPAQAASFAAGMFDRIDSPAAAVSADRPLSLQVSERRPDPARAGSSPAALASAYIIELSFEPIQWLGSTTQRPAPRPTRSPAQPRAPPANT